MLLTVRSGAVAAGSSCRPNSITPVAIVIAAGRRPSRRGYPTSWRARSALLASIRRQVPFLGIFLRGGLDHRADHLLVRLDPVRHELPGLAVPLEDTGLTAAGMV